MHIERLNLSYNALVEFHDEILSRHTHLIELDLSHNQITTLKLNEVILIGKQKVKIFGRSVLAHQRFGGDDKILFCFELEANTVFLSFLVVKHECLSGTMYVLYFYFRLCVIQTIFGTLMQHLMSYSLLTVEMVVHSFMAYSN